MSFICRKLIRREELAEEGRVLPRVQRALAGFALAVIASSFFCIAPLGAVTHDRHTGAGPVPRSGFDVRFRSRHFVPSPGYPALERNRSESALTIGDVGANVHLLLQPRDPHDRGWKDRVAAAGIHLLHYVPHNTWIASVPAALGPAGPVLEELRWLGVLEPRDRISSRLQDEGPGLWAVEGDGRVRLRVTFFADVSPARAEALLEAVGAEVLVARGHRMTYTVLLEPESVDALPTWDEVCWVIEAPPRPIPLNDGLRANIRADTLTEYPYSLSGVGVDLGFWDDGDVDIQHQDLQGRVTLVDQVGTAGHATHVAGTVAGNGSRSQPEGGAPYQWAGVATESYLFSYSFYETPVEDHDSAINTYGIDMSQNSWGYGISGNTGTCPYYGDYIWDAPQFDDIVTGYYGRRVPVVFAVGNERDDGDCGIPERNGYACVAPPATAKNTINVGGTYSDTDSMALFSSWGPVDDGRLRPDLVAPGSESGGDFHIVSTEPGNGYGGRNGTSMSAPAVSGTMALLLEEFRLLYPTLPAPLPSTYKAILIQGARDSGRPGPDYEYGWGALDAWTVVDLLRTQSVIEDELDDQEVVEFPFYVPAGEPKLRISIAWDDEPGLEGADPALVNDLDLLLIDPQAGEHYPWILDPDDPSAPATTGVDTVNNVEQVEITSPDSGQWVCRVTGPSVPVGPQPVSILGIDGRAPAPVTEFALEAVGDTAVNLYWANPEDLDFAGSLVIRADSAISWAPEDGTTYVLDEEVAPGMVVVYLGDDDHSVNPLRDEGLLIGFVYHYRAFSYDDHLNYADGVGDSIQVGSLEPEVVATAPTPFTLAVEQDAPLSFTFSASIDSTTIDSTTVRVVGTVSGPHWGAVTMASEGRQVHLDPDLDFAPGEGVEVVLSPAIHSGGGYPLTGGYSFTFVVDTPGTGTGNFVAHDTVYTGENALAVCAADMDRDGDADALVVNRGDGSLSLLRNTEGFLAVDTSYAVGVGGVHVAVADFDGDGMNDVVVGTVETHAVTVFRNLGDGRLAQDSVYTLIGAPGGLATADLDRDGLPELAVTLEDSSYLVIFSNSGGELAVASVNPVSSGPRGMAVGDVDDDRDQDLVVMAALAGSIQVFLNEGDGSFTPGWSDDLPGKPSEAVLADLDADGDLDLAVMRRAVGQVEIFQNYYNTGDFGVFAPASYQVGGLPWKIVAADADRDNDLDLMLSLRQGLAVGILRNLGGGEFLDLVSTPAGGMAAGLAAVDVVGDGDVDLVVTLFDLGAAVVLLNINETSGVESPGSGLRPDLVLYGIRPNPFRPESAVLAFSLDHRRPVRLAVYDVTGREIACLIDGVKEMGYHEVRWDGRGRDGAHLSPGVYFLRLKTDIQAVSRKIILSPSVGR